MTKNLSQQHELNVSCTVFYQKEGKQQKSLFAIGTMQEGMSMIAALLTMAATGQKVDDIGHPLFGAEIHGFTFDAGRPDKLTKGVINDDQTIERKTEKTDSRTQNSEIASGQ